MIEKYEKITIKEKENVLSLENLSFLSLLSSTLSSSIVVKV